MHSFNSASSSVKTSRATKKDREKKKVVIAPGALCSQQEEVPFSGLKVNTLVFPPPSSTCHFE